jgi:hypothetical protein
MDDCRIGVKLDLERISRGSTAIRLARKPLSSGRPIRAIIVSQRAIFDWRPVDFPEHKRLLLVSDSC